MSLLKISKATKSAGKFILVDDDDAWLNLIQVLVPDHKLTLCPTAEEALQLVRAGQVSLLITDTILPGMSGIDLLKEIRRDPRHDALPIIVLFGGLKSSPATKGTVMKLGATAVITKDEFLLQLDSLLGRVQLR